MPLEQIIESVRLWAAGILEVTGSPGLFVRFLTVTAIIALLAAYDIRQHADRSVNIGKKWYQQHGGQLFLQYMTISAFLYGAPWLLQYAPGGTFPEEVRETAHLLGRAVHVYYALGLAIWIVVRSMFRHRLKP